VLRDRELFLFVIFPPQPEEKELEEEERGSGLDCCNYCPAQRQFDSGKNPGTDVGHKESKKEN
jgi:hypothetical protein